jgi:hypothetical protein
MVNIGYHTAKVQGKLIRSLYQAGLSNILHLPILQAQKLPIIVYSFSCERDLPEQIASIRSFLHEVGIPNQFIVISDGSYTNDSCNLIRQIHACVEVMHVDKLMRTDLPQYVYEFAAQHPLGKKFLALLSIPIQSTTIYTDSDILFFPGATHLKELIASEQRQPWYLTDCACKVDEQVLFNEDERNNPVNSGFIILNQPLDWSLALERLSKKQTFNHYFTEQSLVHLTMHQNCGQPLCPKLYVVSVKDQFIYPDKCVNKEVVLRHYVSDIRHKFWLKVKFK